MEQIRNESKGMGTAICDGDYRNRPLLSAQLFQYCSVLVQVRLGVGSSVYTSPLGGSDEESSSKHFFSLLLNMLSISSFLSALELNMVFLMCILYTTVWKHMLDVANPSPYITNEAGMTALHVKQMLTFNLICWIEKQLWWGQSRTSVILCSSS